METKNIISKQGFKELKDEIKILIEVERPKVIEEIKDARALGDLSENAEFDAAREKQGQIEDRIKEIESILENSTIISSKSKSKKVRVGSEVTYQDLSNSQSNTVTIVGSLEADPFKNMVSNSSPLGEALLNAEENDVVTIQVNQKYDVKVTKVKN